MLILLSFVLFRSTGQNEQTTCIQAPEKEGNKIILRDIYIFSNFSKKKYVVAIH